MVNTKGRYSLILNSDDEEMVFDFSVMDFMNKDQIEKNDLVFLATIDKMTTLFTGSLDLLSYLDKRRYDPSFDLVNTKIRYRGSNGENIYLDTVYQDDTLAKISKCANGSYIDLNDATTRCVLADIYREISDSNSEFSKYLVASKSITTNINDYNKKIVSLAHDNLTGEMFYYFLKSFMSYREFRALYLSYEKYKSPLKEKGYSKCK